MLSNVYGCHFPCEWGCHWRGTFRRGLNSHEWPHWLTSTLITIHQRPFQWVNYHNLEECIYGGNVWRNYQLPSQMSDVICCGNVWRCHILAEWTSIKSSRVSAHSQLHPAATTWINRWTWQINMYSITMHYINSCTHYNLTAVINWF